MGHFSLLTFNCFGTPTPTTRRRLLTLARELDYRGDTLVCLQEVQTNAYRKLLTRACARYPHIAFEPFVHAPKGGLLTLAQLPIEQSDFVLYAARDLWYTPAVMDWILHKGVLCTRLVCADLPVVVFNTHLTANYSGDWGESNRYARNERNQLQQLAALVRAQPPEALVVVCGDFNIPRGSWLYGEFLAASGLTDPLLGDTRATYRVLPGIPARYALPIDFALVRAPQIAGLKLHSDLCFQTKHEMIGGSPGYLSDHIGVELQITW